MLGWCGFTGSAALQAVWLWRGRQSAVLQFVLKDYFALKVNVVLKVHFALKVHFVMKDQCALKVHIALK